MRYLVHTPGFVYFHAVIYPGMFPTFYVLRLVNTWLTVLLTVDRYIATCRPLHAQRLCTMKRTYGLITVVVLASVAFCVPRYFESVHPRFLFLVHRNVRVLFDVRFDDVRSCFAF